MHSTVYILNQPDQILRLLINTMIEVVRRQVPYRLKKPIQQIPDGFAIFGKISHIVFHLTCPDIVIVIRHLLGIIVHKLMQDTLSQVLQYHATLFDGSRGCQFIT